MLDNVQLESKPKTVSRFLFEQLRRQSALWDAIIPKCARLIEIGATHTTYVHPTKGRRSVNNVRLGLAGPIFR